MFSTKMRTITLALTVAAFAAPAAGQTHAEVFVIHGIPGADVPGGPLDLPVDVSVGGVCALPDFRFGQIIGPLSFTSGEQDIAVHFPATGACSSPVVIGPATIPFVAGETSTVLAHLDGSGGLTASKFVTNVGPTPNGRSRVTLYHTANAPAVDLYLTSDFGSPLDTRGLATSVVNGESAAVPVAGQPTEFAITAAGQPAAAFGPVELGLQPDRAYFLYVVGSLTNDSLAVIAKDVSELR